jgi:dihydroorotate dehydrogenase
MALGAERSQKMAIRTLRMLSRVPFGLKFIDFLGHMAPDARLDPRGDALRSFSRFGVGLVEVGPADVEDLARNLERRDPQVPVLVHLAKSDHVRDDIERLRNDTAMFVVDPANVCDARGDVVVLSRQRDSEGAAGVWMHGGADAVRTLRSQLSPDKILIAAGAAEPHEVKALLDAGATVVSVDMGLATSGPGLIKRCNEALLSAHAAAEPEPFTLDAARRAWFWAFLMGIAMFIGGVMAVVIASTRVVLPYDESLCGLTRAQMAALNPRLLPFMAHDRMSLAGAMLSIGIFYAALGWSGIRRGSHWAQVAVVVSATVGFFSFFTFLGFGYFDPFHAFVTAIVTQFMLLCLVMQPSPAQPPVAEWRETAAWRRGQWGQLLFILMGFGLTTAGIVMTVIGCTRVFVESDLAFMRTTAAELRLSYERLVPLVAHDRATLGGLLIANGITVWLSAQWGFRAGTGWLWHALAWGGNIAFACAVAVHVVVGYDDPLHLAPAVAGWVVWNVALGLTKAWLCDGGAARA